MMAAPWSLDRCAVGGQGSLEGAGAVTHQTTATELTGGRTGAECRAWPVHAPGSTRPGPAAVVPGVLFNARLTPPQVRLAIQPARQNALFIHLVLS